MYNYTLIIVEIKLWVVLLFIYKRGCCEILLNSVRFPA